ncbi:MAG: multidrug resistance protein [Bacteroidota bacterium]
MANTKTVAIDKSQDFKIGLVYLAIDILVSVAAQLLLKRGMMELGEFEFSGGVSYLLSMINPMIIGGLILYACGTVGWLLCLTKLDLSFAYPAGTMQYLFIFLGAWMWFDENISLLRIAGLVVICIGVVVLALDMKKS